MSGYPFKVLSSLIVNLLALINNTLLSKHYNIQINAIKNLHTGDFMQIFDKDGNQKMRVDAHFERSGPLTKEQIKSLNRDDYMKEAKKNLKK